MGGRIKEVFEGKEWGTIEEAAETRTKEEAWEGGKWAGGKDGHWTWRMSRLRREEGDRLGELKVQGQKLVKREGGRLNFEENDAEGGKRTYEGRSGMRAIVNSKESREEEDK